MTITFSHRGSDGDARIDTWIAVGGVTVIMAIAVLTAGCSSAPSLMPDAGGDADVPVEDLRAAAMAELRNAQLGLVDWRFRPDPERRGETDRWFTEDHDDAAWSALAAGATWEAQGFPDYDGVGWYRTEVAIPAAWAGSRVELRAFGIDDEYDLWVNGEHVAHYGEPPDRSVWGWQTRAELGAKLRPGATNTIAIRVVDWGGGGGIWRRIELRRSVPLDRYRVLLPEPIVTDNPEWTRLYWSAWQMAFDKVSFGTVENGLSEAFMDEGFNEQIYQWDSTFITLFGRYGIRLFPVMATLDNFYGKQAADGYIQRVYSETDGRQLGAPSADEPMVNPPLFAWVEWQYYAFTGDASRLSRVFPILERYFYWLRDHVRRLGGGGLYYQSELGSGMDNTPRGPQPPVAWIDMSAQQALAALHLARIAEAIGIAERAAVWRAEHAAIAAGIEATLWSEPDGYYYDKKPDGDLTGIRHIGAYWTLISNVASPTRAARLVAHLRDPRHFYRPFLFPSLSAADPAYDPDGHYWRGGIWAPTNDMVIRGLALIGEGAFAREAASRHLAQLALVYDGTAIDAASVAPEERDGEYATLWECYAPETARPATRWDDRFLSRQDFVGWSGLAPIAMLVEQVIGIEVRAADQRVVWTITRTDRHGVTRLPLGTGTVDLLAAPRASAATSIELSIATDRAFSLEVRRGEDASAVYAITPGTTTLVVP
jgi:hypothetical protein